MTNWGHYVRIDLQPEYDPCDECHRTMAPMVVVGERSFGGQFCYLCRQCLQRALDLLKQAEENDCPAP